MKVSIGDKSLHVARPFEDTLNYVYVEKDVKTKKEKDKELNYKWKKSHLSIFMKLLLVFFS